jgi:DNA-binding FrmR family transcriptional regulator
MVDPSLAAVLARLKRIEGHLDAVIGMVTQGRPCLELAQQLHAVERAIASTKRTLVHARIDACLSAAANIPEETKPLLNETRSLAKYL